MITDKRVQTIHVDQCCEGPDGEPVAFLARHIEAPAEQVKAILDSPEGTGDGRSGWRYFRLPDGTLILGVFPQGDTYSQFEKTHSF